MKINLKQLREKEVDEWSSEEISFIIKFLLNLLKPYFTRQNIIIPSIRKNLILEDSFLDKHSRSCKGLPSKKYMNLEITDENNEIKLGKKKIQDLPVNIASKIVASNLR